MCQVATLEGGKEGEKTEVLVVQKHNSEHLQPSFQYSKGSYCNSFIFKQQLIIVNNPKHTADAVKAHLDGKIHNGTISGSAEFGPQHYLTSVGSS